MPQWEAIVRTLPTTEDALPQLQLLALPVFGVSTAFFFILSLALGKRWTPSAAALPVLAALAAYHGIEPDGLPIFPDAATWTWTILLTVSAAILGAAGAWPGDARGPVAILALNLGLFGAFFLPRDIPSPAVWQMGVFGLLVVVNWVLLDRVSLRAPGGFMPFALGVAFFNASLMIEFVTFGKLAQFAMALGAAYFGLAFVAFVRGVDVRGSLGAPSLLLPACMVLCTQTFGFENQKMPWLAYALTACTPLPLAILLIPPISSWTGWKTRLLGVFLLLLPSLIWVAIAIDHLVKLEAEAG